MRIKAEQLAKECEKPLLPVYLISGDEPLLVQEAMDMLRRTARKQEYFERTVLDVDRYFDWQRLLDEAGSLSLFAERKLTELRMGSSKPGTPGSKVLIQYCERLPEDTILLIEMEKLDGAALKSKWVQAIEKCGALIQIWPIALNEMPRWLAQRAQTRGVHLEPDAIAILASRLEGNLLAANQELEKLKLLHGDARISADMIEQEVADSSRYDVFDLTDACIQGQARHAAKILSQLRVEGFEAMRVLWALSREVRMLAALAQAQAKGQPDAPLLSHYRVIPKRQPQIRNAVRRHAPAHFNALLVLCKDVDDSIKGIRKDADPWQLMLDVSVGLALA